MPDIIRLRTSMETTSAIYSKRNSLRPRDNNILLLRRSNADRAVDVWLHCAGDEFDNRNDDRIPELPVCLCIRDLDPPAAVAAIRSEEHTSELQSLMSISYAVFCLKKK